MKRILSVMCAGLAFLSASCAVVGKREAAKAATPAQDKAIMKELKALGYIDSEPEQREGKKDEARVKEELRSLGYLR